MGWPAKILFIVYGVVSLVHLFFCLMEMEKARKITKLFCMPFLIAAAIVAVPGYPLIYIAPFFGLIGDFLLIWKKKLTFFILGMVAFLINHSCYFAQIIIFLTKTGTSVPWYFFMVMGIALFAITIGIYPFTKKLAGRAALLGNVYMPFMVCVGIMSAWLLSELHINYPAMFILLGYVIFLLSDGILIYTKFKKDVKRRDFFIMSTYLIAQFLIVFGMVLIEVIPAWA